ncbi:MAG: type II secretion system protein [Candidatus Methylacidiphilales bacterium]|nr:type II secretion system protein [Candidatus Methylacidiphilales bacterium]
MTAPLTFTGRRAFSLVELLVVLAITALLAGMLYPAVERSRMSALTITSTSNLRQLALANLAYLSENGRYAPADDQSNKKRWHGGRTSVGKPFDPTQGYLSPYLGGSRAVSLCPVLKQQLTGGGTFEEGTGGYGYNASYVGGTPSWAYNSDGSRVSARAADIVLPSTTVMFTSSAYANGDHVQEYPYSEPPFWDFGDGPSGFRPSPTTHFRFNGKALVAWCDGHVALVAKETREVGDNPHNGDAVAQQLGWFGPDEENGFWNPKREP